MIITLSPSKGQDFETPPPLAQYTTPDQLENSQMLIDELRKETSESIQKLMAVSQNIADLNVGRFRRFTLPFTPENAKQAIFAFRGDVYGGLNADAMSEDDLQFAQKHLRMLSGLYGALRPLDLIQPYRLEMKTRLANPRGANLYQFWDTRITDQLNDAMAGHKEQTLINLASNEYFKAVKPKHLKGRLLHINFKEEKDGKTRVIAIFAKRARGLMANYIITNRIDESEAIKDFDAEGYRFDTELSDDSQWTFTRPQPSKK